MALIQAGQLNTEGLTQIAFIDKAYTSRIVPEISCRIRLYHFRISRIDRINACRSRRLCPPRARDALRYRLGVFLERHFDVPG
jgi:hypothetical protein